MKAKMIRPRELRSFELDEDDQVWKQINDHHLYYIYDSIYYDGWKYAVYDVGGEEFLSKVKFVGIGRKGAVKSKRFNNTLSHVAKELDVSPCLIEDIDGWQGGDPM